MKKLAALAALALIVVGGVFGYQKFKENALIEATAPIVKEASVRTKTASDYLLAPGNITFGEVFDGTSDVIKKLGDLSITLESQNANTHPEAIKAGTEYLKASQILARNINAIVRARFESHTASKRAEAIMKDFTSSNQYTREHALERSKSTLSDMQAAIDKSEALVAPTKESIEALKSARDKVSKFYPEDALLPKSVFADLDAYFTDEDKKP